LRYTEKNDICEGKMPFIISVQTLIHTVIRKNDICEGKMPFIITVYIRAYSIKENSFHQNE
jgi:hypothetical protein